MLILHIYITTYKTTLRVVDACWGGVAKPQMFCRGVLP